MCISPVTLKQPNGEFQTFSCGRCFECVRKRKNEWVVRLHAEMYAADCSFFSLISYNEDNYPIPDNYDIPAIQRLMKSLRQRLKRNFHYMRKDPAKPISMKYFIVSEYGELKNRLHYHANFFLYNVKEHDCNFVFWKSLLEDTWNKGFCSAFELTQKTIVYTTKYIQKQYNMMLYSKGFGFDAYKSVYGNRVLKYNELDTYLINGKSFVCPRSWREKLRSGTHNSVAAHCIYCETRDLPKLLSERDRLMLHHKFVADNPRVETKEDVPKLDSSVFDNNTDFDL